MIWPRIRHNCGECEGWGYAAFLCDSRGHSPIELQRSDACNCLEERLSQTSTSDPSDDDAAMVFVRDLESGNFPRPVLQQLLEYGGPKL